MNNWVVIAGGTSNGKTSLINLLAERGYITIPEAARSLIDEGLARGQTLQQIRGDVDDWQKRVLKRGLDNEANLDQNSLIFFDRGIHDGLSFLELNNIKPGKVWESIFNHPRRPYYKTVFSLDPLPTFEQNYARNENLEIAKKLHRLTDQIYNRFGMPPIHIPVLPTEERLKLVLAHLGIK